MVIYSQPSGVCLSRGDGAIQRPPKHLWMSDKPQKRALAIAPWATFSTDTSMQLLIIISHSKEVLIFI